MLVLTRTKGERVKIGDDIWVTIAQVKGGRVRLAIEAPRGVNIAREEVSVTIPDQEYDHGEPVG